MDKQKFIKQLEELVRLQTLPGNLTENAKALDLVESWLTSGVEKKRVKNGNAEILIAGNREVLAPEVAFLVHMDVVAGRDDQFEMRVEDDRIIGRGASDMKFSVPMGIAILNELVERKALLSFSLVITTDEEVGGFEGAKFLEEGLKFRPKLLIVPDGGDNLIFVNKAKGICQLLVSSKGKPAHASRPWLGRNALEPLVLLAEKLLGKFGENNRTESWKTTMNLGVIQGGTSTNQVCPEAIMKLDFRFPESVSEKELVGEVTEIAKECGGGLKIEVLGRGLPTFTDDNLPIVKKFIEEMEKVIGRKIEVKPTYGGSDARWFAKHDIPVLMIKPVGGEIHSDDEWISLQSCLEFHQGIRNFLFELQ